MTAPLDDTAKQRLREAAEAYSQARGTPLAIAKQVIWQAYQVKGLEIACAFGHQGQVQAKAKREYSDIARNALNQLLKKRGSA